MQKKQVPKVPAQEAPKPAPENVRKAKKRGKTEKSKIKRKKATKKAK